MSSVFSNSRLCLFLRNFKLAFSVSFVRYLFFRVPHIWNLFSYACLQNDLSLCLFFLLLWIYLILKFVRLSHYCFSILYLFFLFTCRNFLILNGEYSIVLFPLLVCELWQLVEQYGKVWHHSRVRRYLTSEDWLQSESKGRPWFGLLTLLRKYPEHFVINTRSKGRVTSEFVSLVSLLS